jgi:RES domain-containing protein
MLAWKIGNAAHIQDLGGSGAARFGGRWNHPDHPALYLSLSPASGALELFLMAGALPRLPLKLMRLQLPDDPTLYCTAAPEQLPIGWNTLPADYPSMDFGTQWLERNEQLGLILPSVAMEQTSCLLINPLHPAAHRIQVLCLCDVEPGRYVATANSRSCEFSVEDRPRPDRGLHLS